MINQQTLELYVYVDGVNDIPFLSGEYEEYILVNGEQFITSDNKVFNVRMLNENIIIHAFTYNAQRMGGAPTISATINFPECLDELFSEKVYAVFNGEKYFLLATPSSSYSAESVMYKHDATFVSERIALENTYYYDVVAEDYDGDKPASNNSEFVFFGDIHEFAERMNYSLNYSGLDYTVVVDEGIESEEELLSVENKFFSEVLQEVYNVYELPYYFVGKTIHIGYTTNAISEVFRYGDSDALVSISKNNANSRVINRATGIGSEDNLPHYYPNTTPKGDIVAIANENNTSVTNDTIEIVNAIRYSEKIELGKEVKYVDWLSGTDISLEPRVDNTLAVSMYDDQKNVRVTTELLYEDRNKVEDRTLTWQLSMTLYHADYKNIPGKGQIKVKPIIRLNESSWANHAFDEVPTYSPKFELIVPNIATFEGEWGSSTQDGIICELKDGYFILPPIEEWLGVYNSQPKVRLTLSNLKIVCSTNAEYKLFTDWEIDKVGHWEYEGKEIDLEDCGIRILANATSGDSFYQSTKSYIQPQKKLMPPIYRESLGAERFYDAISDVYPIPDEQGQDSGLKYEFENEYNGNNPKEQIVQFEEIKPTIKEMTNSEGLRIDMFTEFAYDDDDNDETYETEEGSIDYQHPLFFAKLRKLDFNLFEHAIDDGEMTIAMTNGKCGGCEFRVAVDADSKKNTVQVDENGNLVRDDNGNVLCGRPTQASVDEQDRQQDTINNEVWIALYKDKDTFGEIMPNATNDYRPTACTSATSNDGDTFVILHISLPQQYILAAEERLRQQIIQFIYDNNVEKFNFSVKFSRIYFAEHPEFLQLLDENARITIEYNEKTHLLYVSSISYKTTESDILPEVTVELKDEISVTQNSIQKATNQVKSDLYRTLAGIDVVAQGTQVFLRKDQPDTAKEQITFKQKPILQSGAILEDTISSKDYFEGIKGISINKDANNNWHIETDYLHARKKFSAKEVEIQKVYHIGGAQIKSSASLVCTRVDDIGSAYRCWFDTIDDDGNIINNEFVAGDQAYVQTFNLITDSDGNTTNHFYWRLVESVTADSIVLSKAECAEGSTIPMAGDHIVQLGYQGDDKPERQVAVIDAGAGEGAPYYRQYVGINSFALPEPETQLKPNDNILTGKVVMQAGSSGLENFDEWESKQNEIDYSRDYIDNTLPVTIAELQAQIDGTIENYFYDYDPTLENYPANEWTTNELKESHIGDTFTNTQEYVDDETTPNAGKSWRWLNKNGVYGWYAISDTDALKALALAQQAKDTADGKRRVFIVEPFTPYDKGDLWAGGDSLPLKRCRVSRASGDYVEADWELADYSDKTQTVIDDGIITSGTIQLGDRGTSVKAGITGDGTSDGSIRIWAGDGVENRETAPFRVTQDGTLYATKGEFNGTINVAEGVFSVDESGKVTATNADIKGVVNATSGTFSNVIVNGSIRSPFLPAYYIEGEMPELPDGADNLHSISGSMGGYVDLDLIWDNNQSGRRLTLVGTYRIESPSEDLYFYENGYESKVLTTNSELVELLGYARWDYVYDLDGNIILGEETFRGWIVLSRTNFSTNYPYGRNATALAMGVVDGISSTPTINAETFNGDALTITRQSAGTYRVALPTTWFDSLNDCIVNCSIVQDSTDEYRAISILVAKYDTEEFYGLEFATFGGIGVLTDSKFNFIVYPLKQWA